jgi:Mce-associated membrane protein
VTVDHVALDDVTAEDLEDVHTESAADPDSDDSDVASVDHPLQEDGPDAANPSRTTDTRRNWARRALARWPVIVVGLLLVASAGVAAGLYWQYRVDQHRNAGAETAVIAAASADTVALLSYSPENLDRDLAAAKSHLTGDFLTYYSKFADQIVAPAAKEKAVTTHASVVRAAVAELQPDSAKVMVFVNQNTTSRDNPYPVQAASSVMVTLTKVNGAWLISAFDPM